MTALNITIHPDERILNVIEQNCATKRLRLEAHATARIGSEILFDKHIFDTYHYDGWKDVHHDLLVICAAVEFADRRWARGTSRWARKLHIVVPVVELKLWLSEKVKRHLRETLRHLTGDEWRFSFVEWQGPTSDDERQRPLPFQSQKEFAVAYSDGLDSRCVSGLFNRSDIAVSVRVAKTKQQVGDNELPFDRIPFNVKVSPAPEDSFRSRGFKFAAITAIAANLSGLKRIIVPESGQGALGPVLVPLHNIYSDYRNHPTFFRKMEGFISALLQHEIAYEQPRLWYTKGQTISAFLAMPKVNPDHVLETRSCWHQRHYVRFGGTLRQCGICAACLLRRSSIFAAGVEEPDETYAISNLGAGDYEAALPADDGFHAKRPLREYGVIGTRHMQQMADLAKRPDDELRCNALELAESTGCSEQETLEKLRGLLGCHADEWSRFLIAQGKESFLNDWTKGGRYD